MGGKASGNRRDRKKLPPELKSRTVQFRLDPKKEAEGHAWALERTEYYTDQYLSVGKQTAEFYIDLLLCFENRERVEPTVLAGAGDIVDIKQLVQYIADKIETGELVRPASGKPRRKKEQQVELSDSMRATLDKYISGGLLGDDEDEE